MKTLILTLISVSLVNNVVLSQFLGLCPFLGVSKQTKTAMSMGGAVIFVITIASAVTHLLYRLLVLLHVEYLETVAFILIIAALVQFVELFLKKYFPPLYNSLGVYLPLITTNCAVLGVALIVKPLNTQSPISSSITDDQPTSSAVSEVLVKNTSP